MPCGTNLSIIRCMRRIVLLPLVLAAQAFANQPQTPAPWPLRVETLVSPAAAGSAQPQLSVSSRGVLLSWIETAGNGATLRFSERTATGGRRPRSVASGTDWFVNWADVPSVVRLADGTLAAHWLQKSGSGTYAYDVRMSHSRDDGKTWSPSVTPHDDGTQTEHGFASLFQMPGSGLGAVWLDGRNMKGGHAGAGGEHGSGDMSLRFAGFDRNWKRTGDAALDLRVCECCPTAVAVTSEGPIVAYRDRSATEVRDIVVTRMEKGKWTEPRAIAEEGWVFPACPVNGPSLSARGRNVAAAWFQAKDNKPKAFVAFSSDAGRTFGAPIRLDQDGTLGRVDIELLPDGSAAAGYIDLTGESRRIPRQTCAARRLRLGAGHDRESRQQPLERVPAHGAARKRAGLRLDRSRRRVDRAHGRRSAVHRYPLIMRTTFGAGRRDGDRPHVVAGGAAAGSPCRDPRDPEWRYPAASARRSGRHHPPPLLQRGARQRRSVLRAPQGRRRGVLGRAARQQRGRHRHRDRLGARRPDRTRAKRLDPCRPGTDRGRSSATA